MPPSHSLFPVKDEGRRQIRGEPYLLTPRSRHQDHLSAQSSSAATCCVADSQMKKHQSGGPHLSALRIRRDHTARHLVYHTILVLRISSGLEPHLQLPPVENGSEFGNDVSNGKVEF
jgi:hypothetical protein